MTNSTIESLLDLICLPWCTVCRVCYIMLPGFAILVARLQDLTNSFLGGIVYNATMMTARMPVLLLVFLLHLLIQLSTLSDSREDSSNCQFNSPLRVQLDISKFGLQQSLTNAPMLRRFAFKIGRPHCPPGVLGSTTTL